MINGRFLFSMYDKVLNIDELHVYFIISYCDQVNERDISILKNVIEVLNIEQAKHNIINSSCSFAMRLFPLIIIANIVNILKVQLSKIKIVADGRPVTLFLVFRFPSIITFTITL